ncbi:MAG TPA: glycosyltransferase family 4 protein [Anaerolineae bacterium]|nr:glycosyltransferase family 4 protein [Anaerolineae bacterium]
MKILILTPQLPYPPHQGTILRNFHIIKGVAQKHEVSLLSYLEPKQPKEEAEWGELPALCAEIVTVAAPSRTMGKRVWQLVSSSWPDLAHRLYDERFVAALREMLRGSEFDVVQIEGLELAWALAVVEEEQPEARVLFDAHNVETAIQERALATDWRRPRRWAAAVYSAIQVRRLRRFERWVVQMAAATTAVSATDAALLAALVGGKRQVVAIPNTIDVEAYGAPAEGVGEAYQFDLVFSGKMDYRPNVDGVRWFGEEVWPLVVAVRPGTTWGIVGNKPVAAVVALGDEAGITVTGWVPEIQPYLWGAKLCILPLRMGSGTRLKLIEAAAAGKGMVSTRVGAEGFDLMGGEVLVLADGAAEMAAEIVRLLGDEAEREALGERARVWAKRYDWRVVVPAFEAVYRQMGV